MDHLFITLILKTTGNTCGCYRCGGSHSGLGTKTICTYDGEGIIIRKSPQKLQIQQIHS